MNDCNDNGIVNGIGKGNGNGKYKNITGAGGIIFDPLSMNVLVVKGREKWSLPKGHREQGEALHQTAMREIYEETSIHINLTSSSYFKRILKCVYYLISIPDGRKLSVYPIDYNEIREVKWCTYYELTNLDGNKQLQYLIRNWNQIIYLMMLSSKNHEMSFPKILITKNQNVDNRYQSQNRNHPRHQPILYSTKSIQTGGVELWNR